MVERGITEAEVAAVIANPQIDHPGNPEPGKPPSRVLYGKVEDRSLKIVIRETDSIVITVMEPEM